MTANMAGHGRGFADASGFRQTLQGKKAALCNDCELAFGGLAAVSPRVGRRHRAAKYWLAFEFDMG
jgi:hypothetical protein